MTQNEAQFILLLMSGVASWALVMAHISNLRPNRYWWLVPIILATPAFAKLITTAILG